MFGPIAGLIVVALCLWAAPVGALFQGFTPEDAAPPAALPVDAGMNAAPKIHALPFNDGEQIKVDGRLDDAIWQRASAASGFQKWSPDRGGEPSQQTVFKVAYDQDAIYFAFACLEDDPSQITQCLSRRDHITSSDNVAIYIDPYHDRTTGYNFRINPRGVQEDFYVFDDGETDRDWDAVWQAETSRDDDGWYAEIRIPFSSIRYRADAPAWGLQVYRYMHSRGEDTAWTVWDRETAGFVSRFGTLHGITGIPVPRQLEILPYMVAQTTDYAVTGPEETDNFQNLGLDLKYGLTADLTLNATFQPDFGQVEADPATLNLSPFETYFEEKRPFFVEGNRFFQHRGFNLFHSRRIGAGNENSRIRYAAKLTGKTAGDISVAALFAGTDITADGQTHNFLKNGTCPAQYVVGRFGKEFNQGHQRINFMQTAVLRSASREACGDYASREAYTSGLDFELQFHDRDYALSGSLVGSVIDPEALESDPSVTASKSYGTGGSLNFHKAGGKIRGSIWGRWESDRLDLNDIGFLHAPDEIASGLWLGYTYSPNGSSPIFLRGNFNFNLNGGWLYAPRAGYDLHTGEETWNYGRGHRSVSSSNFNGWMQLKNFAETWWGISFNPEGTRRYDTRSTVIREDGEEVEIPGGGPLISEPYTLGGWWGANTDSRKDLVFGLDLNYWDDAARNISRYFGVGIEWNQSNAVHHSLNTGFQNRIDDTQHLGNFENPGGGIGGVSYVYGVLHQKVFDLTLRSNVLFSRNQSLELYVQPYLTVGDYRQARELARPDSYDLAPYECEGFNVDDYDFNYSAVNLNLVYRWEYRPGSTIYLVWAHTRLTDDERGFHETPGRFKSNLDPDTLFSNEPENRFMVKVSYWMPV
ncbi:MAG: carbohydrate binding family 9 domain-containing protein [Candidatus Eisenbacteria sp.]|nr:carbohydrate binding family 9 domain-containing protein [Candidatus Eisenbacteria bacterium]